MSNPVRVPSTDAWSIVVAHPRDCGKNKRCAETVRESYPFCWIVRRGADPVAIFGIQTLPSPADDRVGLIWMEEFEAAELLGTVAFARHSKRVERAITRSLPYYRKLTGWTLVSRPESTKFLRWLGYTVSTKDEDVVFIAEHEVRPFCKVLLP